MRTHRSQATASTTILFLLACLVAIPTQVLAQQEPEAQAAQAEVPGTRPVTKAFLEEVAFGRTIDPVETIRGDHTASGISLRNRGGGVINLRGVPEKATAIKSYLYWDILDDKSRDAMKVSINGVGVVGKLIGEGACPCWSPKANFVYRAEVPLYLLYNGINGDYKISGFPSSIGTGSNPWKYHGSAPLVEGATLVVFYSSERGYKRTHIYEQPVSGFMFAGTFSTVLSGFSPQGRQAKFTLVGADGQIGGGLRSLRATSAEKSFFQGVQIAGPTAAPPGAPNNDSDWNGHDSEPLNQLWDTRTHIVTIKAGSPTAAVRYESKGDCLVVVAFFLSM